jgi:Fe-S-cluster containining protein
LILPEEKEKIEALAAKANKRVRIIPRLGFGKNADGTGPKKIAAYQMMGEDPDGNLCSFLKIEESQRSPHGGFACKIYVERPLACRAYPVISESNNSAELDTKCTFCHEFSCSSSKKNGLQSEIEALAKIKAGFYVDQKTEIWRYATNTGDQEKRAQFLQEGWVLQNI